IGQLVNQFPAAVAKAFPANAKNLWVIMPGETGELAVVAPQQQQTLFGSALFTALRAEEAKSARVSLPKLVEQIRDRYALARSDESDLSFWQKLQVLPTTEIAAEGTLPDPTGTALTLPTMPESKQAEPDPTPETKEGDDKKTTATMRRFPFADNMSGVV